MTGDADFSEVFLDNVARPGAEHRRPARAGLGA